MKYRGIKLNTYVHAPDVAKCSKKSLTETTKKVAEEVGVCGCKSLASRVCADLDATIIDCCCLIVCVHKILLSLKSLTRGAYI